MIERLSRPQPRRHAHDRRAREVEEREERRVGHRERAQEEHVLARGRAHARGNATVTIASPFRAERSRARDASRARGAEHRRARARGARGRSGGGDGRAAAVRAVCRRDGCARRPSARTKKSHKDLKLPSGCLAVNHMLALHRLPQNAPVPDRAGRRPRAGAARALDDGARERAIVRRAGRRHHGGGCGGIGRLMALLFARVGRGRRGLGPEPRGRGGDRGRVRGRVAGPRARARRSTCRTRRRSTPRKRVRRSRRVDARGSGMAEPPPRLSPLSSSRCSPTSGASTCSSTTRASSRASRSPTLRATGARDADDRGEHVRPTCGRASRSCRARARARAAARATRGRAPPRRG